MMGLKRENDSMGHNAGDALLVRASECLRRGFGEYALFRVGGDEFLVLCEGISQEEMQERVEAMKVDMHRANALMALGLIPSHRSTGFQCSSPALPSQRHHSSHGGCRFPSIDPKNTILPAAWPDSGVEERKPENTPWSEAYRWCGLKISPADCPRHNDKRLKQGSFVEEVCYRPVVGKRMLVKNTVLEADGRRYRFELAVNIGELGRLEKEYELNEVVMIIDGLRIALAAPI